MTIKKRIEALEDEAHQAEPQKIMIARQEHDQPGIFNCKPVGSDTAAAELTYTEEDLAALSDKGWLVIKVVYVSAPGGNARPR